MGMRYEPDHKERTRHRIVRNASRQFRAKGLDGPGVATVMRASGLTVGGFYKHFGNKDDLQIEAIEEGLRQSRERLLFAAKHAPAGEGWKAIVATYLSLEHCERPDGGCPIAALAPELARGKPAFKRRIEAMIKVHRDEIVPFMPGRDPAEQRRNFIVLFTAMIGAVSLARTMTETGDKERILQAAREHLLKAF